jgi:hypothetical protein
VNVSFVYFEKCEPQLVRTSLQLKIFYICICNINIVKTQTFQRVIVNLNNVNLSNLEAFTKQPQAVDKWRVAYM